MSDFTFKQVSSNEYETFFEGSTTNIFFKVPDGCKIEDYNIEKIDEVASLVGQPSKAAYFEFVLPPDGESGASISPLAGLNFLSKNYIKIRESLYLGDNKEVTINFKDGASPCFETLFFSNNFKSSFIFTPSSFKKLTQEELNKNIFFGSDISTINDNWGLTITLGENTLIENISSCKGSASIELENKVDLSKIRYLDCSESHFNPKNNHFTIAIESDVFKCNKSDIYTDGKAKPSGTINLLKNKYKKEGELNSICLEKTSLSFEGSSSLIADTKALIFSPESRTTTFKKTNKIDAKNEIILSGARLNNSKISSDNQYVTIIKGDVMDSTVNFSKGLGQFDNGVIKNSDIRYSDLKGISGVLTNNLFNCIANNVIFKNDSFIEYSSLVRDVKGRWLELENVSLEEGASLKLYDHSNLENPLKKISNSNIEGSVKIENNTNYRIDSSILKETEFLIETIYKSNEVNINNSVFNGKNRILNVSELSCCEVSDSKIILDKPTKISNQFFSSSEVRDYEAYLKEQARDFATNEKEIGQVTNKLELL